jgi:2-polyprenyl-3-methyl-5-hydroxy-6-metoxy-1,4-benzoquinol methylase
VGILDTSESMKKIIRGILYHPAISKHMVLLHLKLANWAYAGLGVYAAALEGGIHPKHRLMNYHRFFLDAVEPKDRVLDVGCGNGLVARDIAQKAKHVVGIDKNRGIINKARDRCKDSENITFICADATTYQFSESFDKMIFSNVLEHIEDRVQFLVKMKELAPVLLIRVPMINRDWVTFYKRELGLDYRLDPTYYTEYTVESFQRELSKAGLEIEHYSVQFGEIWARVGRTAS